MLKAIAFKFALIFLFLLFTIGNAESNGYASLEKYTDKLNDDIVANANCTAGTYDDPIRSCVYDMQLKLHHTRTLYKSEYYITADKLKFDCTAKKKIKDLKELTYISNERVNIEHIVPQSWYNKKKTQMKDNTLSLATSDILSLHPVLRAENTKRLNKRYCFTNTDPGNCYRLDSDKLRGYVSRVYLYMMEAYPTYPTTPAVFEPSQIENAKRYNTDYPPKPYECKRVEKAIDLQTKHRGKDKIAKRVWSVCFKRVSN